MAGLGQPLRCPGNGIVQQLGKARHATIAGLERLAAGPVDGAEAHMLQRNARLYGVHYMLDRIGDIHLVGRVPLGAVTAEEVDRLLGQVLEAADGDFNTLLELGFAASIRREHAWRTSRGESVANLAAFEHLFG